MSANFFILPTIWATAGDLPAFEQRPTVRRRSLYRRYTEAILRRYLKMSLEAGRAPSLLGRELLFRGRVTSYRVHSFEDVVIFLHDVESCLAKLDTEQQQIVERVAMQEYSLGQASEMMGLAISTVVRRYTEALDSLSLLLLEAHLLDPLNSCQGGPEELFRVSN